MIKGQRELMRLMANIPARVEQNVTRGAVRAATGVFVRAARENVDGLTMSPSAKKTLKKAIQNTSPRLVRGEILGGVRVHKDAWWWRYPEFGTAPRWRGIRRYIPAAGFERYKIKYTKRKKGGITPGADTPGYTGFVRPQPFIRPALDENIEEAMVAAVRYARERALAEILK